MYDGIWRMPILEEFGLLVNFLQFDGELAIIEAFYSMHVDEW